MTFDASGGRRLPRELGDRVALGFVSLLMCGFAGFLSFVLFITDLPPFGWLFSTILFVTHELAFGMLVFFGMLLVWSAAMPQWVERTFDLAWKKLWILIGLAVLPILVLGVLAAMGMTLENDLAP